MIFLTEAEVKALRACLEVAQPSKDDKEPAEIWALADRAVSLMEDDVKAGATDIFVTMRLS